MILCTGASVSVILVEVQAVLAAASDLRSFCDCDEISPVALKDTCRSFERCRDGRVVSPSFAGPDTATAQTKVTRTRYRNTGII